MRGTTRTTAAPASGSRRTRSSRRAAVDNRRRSSRRGIRPRRLAGCGGGGPAAHVHHRRRVHDRGLLGGQRQSSSHHRGRPPRRSPPPPRRAPSPAARRREDARRDRAEEIARARLRAGHLLVLGHQGVGRGHRHGRDLALHHGRYRRDHDHAPGERARRRDDLANGADGQTGEEAEFEDVRRREIGERHQEIALGRDDSPRGRRCGRRRR